MSDYLLLKWGTFKGGEFSNVRANELLDEYFELGASLSAALQKDTTRQKEILCKIIDILDCPITNDWSGDRMTKEEAKEYILEYGKK